MKNKFIGFTVVELMVVMGIIAIIAILLIPALHDFQMRADLENSAEEIVNTLRLAQQKTISSEGASSWGVYFSTSTPPHQYTLFRGANYSSRTTSSDEIHNISGTVLIFTIGLGGGQEAIFDRISGVSQQSGSITLVSRADNSKTKTIYIESSGRIGLTSPAVIYDLNRLKDSRHIHFDYSRYIATSTESLVLTFSYDSFTQTETIVIANNLNNGQINWSGQINVNGQIQQLKIHTHRFNDPILGTQFSIHRDRRYNTRALKIDINDTPDPDSGTLIEYSADGLNIVNTSTYVQNVQWQ